jgi:thiosulfate/3-mercaptopyruvate sulfurtransferase
MHAVAGMSLLFALAGCASKDGGRIGPVIEPEQLAELLASRPAQVRVIDVRDAQAYAGGHVIGATWEDVNAWKAMTFAEDTDLSHEVFWHAKIGESGITGDKPVVIYDGGGMTDAARLWFILQHFGVADASVVNGGYEALRSWIERGDIESTPQINPSEPVLFRPSRNADAMVGLADTEAVRQAVESGEAQIFDSRTDAEYRGERALSNPRAGHLPGAVNLSHQDLLDDTGRLKSPETLADLFAQAGFERGRPIIVHCQSGGRSSLAALAAAQAGYGPVRNYYLSFGKWSRDASCPVVRDTEP